MFIGPCIIVIVEEEKTNLMSLTILFHFLCAQHISDINISIIRTLRLFCWITTLVVLFLVRCVLEFWCGWVGVVSVWQAEACNAHTTPTQPHQNSSTHRTKSKTTNVAIQQNSRKLVMMDILMSETCWAHEKWNKIVTSCWSFILQVLILYCLTYSFYCVKNCKEKQTSFGVGHVSDIRHTPRWCRRNSWSWRI